MQYPLPHPDPNQTLSRKNCGHTQCSVWRGVGWHGDKWHTEQRTMPVPHLRADNMVHVRSSSPQRILKRKWEINDTKEKVMHCTGTQEGSSSLFYLAKAMFVLDWLGHLPMNDCIIADLVWPSDHSPLLMEVNHKRTWAACAVWYCRHITCMMAARRLSSEPLSTWADLKKGNKPWSLSVPHVKGSQRKYMSDSWRNTHRCRRAKSLQQPIMC